MGHRFSPVYSVLLHFMIWNGEDEISDQCVEDTIEHRNLRDSGRASGASVWKYLCRILTSGDQIFSYDGRFEERVNGNIPNWRCQFLFELSLEILASARSTESMSTRETVTIDCMEIRSSEWETINTCRCLQSGIFHWEPANSAGDFGDCRINLIKVFSVYIKTGSALKVVTHLI